MRTARKLPAVSAKVLKGAPVIEALTRRIEESVGPLEVDPAVAIIEATGNESSLQAARTAEKACASLGITARLFRFPSTGAGRELLATLDDLGRSGRFHALMVEWPPAREYLRLDLVSKLPVLKDVDCRTPENRGLLLGPRSRFVPPPVGGCLALLDHYGVSVAGRRTVIVGRTAELGKPLALALIDRDATVTLCHTRTRDLANHTRQAEVVVSAAGREGLIRASMVAPGAVVVDLGSGDVDFPAVRMVASAVTPPQGGVGPVITLMRLWNVVVACRLQTKAGRQGSKREGWV